ncbi:MAG: hypothetical protein GXY85_11325 [Candidatus Brocadiaceae bacterium]|nr:hypothetical protein [Candidatus Brocadiaceae bacterium]
MYCEAEKQRVWCRSEPLCGLRGARSVLALLACCGLVPAVVGAQRIDVEDVCRGIEVHAGQIDDISVSFTWAQGSIATSESGEMQFLASSPGSGGAGGNVVDCVWGERGSKAFLERRWQADDGVDTLSRSAWDGINSTYYVRSMDKDYGQGIVSGEADGNLRLQWRMPFLFTSRMWAEEGETLAEVFRLPGVTVTSDETADGRRCAVLTVPGHSAEGVTEKYWIDLDRGCSLVRFEQIGYTGICVWVLGGIVLKEVAPNVWYPVEGISFEPVTKRAQKYTARQIAVNEGLPDSAFTVEFPPGTFVSDERVGTKYVIHPAGRLAPDMDALVSQNISVAQELLVEGEPVSLPVERDGGSVTWSEPATNSREPDETQGKWPLTWVIAAVGGIVILAGGVNRMMRSRKG